MVQLSTMRKLLLPTMSMLPQPTMMRRSRDSCHDLYNEHAFTTYHDEAVSYPEAVPVGWTVRHVHVLAVDGQHVRVHLAHHAPAPQPHNMCTRYKETKTRHALSSKKGIRHLEVKHICVVMLCPCLFCPRDNFETCLALPTR